MKRNPAGFAATVLALIVAAGCAAGTGSPGSIANQLPGTDESARTYVAAANRELSIPPQADSSAPLLVWHSTQRELFWRYSNAGDYNQDGTVDVTDITALVQVAYAGSPLDESGLGYLADGDRNGEVNPADISVISRNFQLNVASYRLYASIDADDYRLAAGESGEYPLLLADIPLADGEIERGAITAFRFPLADMVPETWYWVVPVSEGVEGAASNLLAITEPPQAKLAVDPIGGMVPYEPRLDATLSTPGYGEISDYSWDLDGDAVFELSSGIDPVISHSFDTAGEYTVGLQVTNDAGFIARCREQLVVDELEFAFHPYRETYDHNGYVDEIEVIIWQSGGKGFVEIQGSNCRGLEGLFGELSYDETAFKYLDYTILPGSTLPWDWTHLVVHGGDSRLHIGLALLKPQELPGVYGDVPLIRLRFDLVAEDSIPAAASVPVDQRFAVTSLGLDAASSSLAWNYWSYGDFNQDGRVLVSDLKQYSFHDGDDVPLEPGSILRLIDTDHNELISLADLAAVSNGYLTSVEGFRVYASPTADSYPTVPDGPNGAGAELLGYMQVQGGTAGSGGRLRYTFEVAEADSDAYFWLRPVLGETEGVASNLVEPGGGLFVSPDFSDPDWEGVTGQGSSISNPYYLGPPVPGKGFDVLATNLPEGEGGVIDPENLSWTVFPVSSADFPAPGVFIPNGPIAMGYIQAEDTAGNLSNKMYFFSAATPGG